MYNNKATKNAKTSNNKKMTTLNRKTIPYQAHHNSANVLQLETKKVNSISKEANMHKIKQREREKKNNRAAHTLRILNPKINKQNLRNHK